MLDRWEVFITIQVLARLLVWSPTLWPLRGIDNASDFKALVETTTKQKSYLCAIAAISPFIEGALTSARDDLPGEEEYKAEMGEDA